MKREYIKQISELDTVIKYLINEQGRSSKDERSKWSKKIDDALDKRKNLMLLRDGNLVK